MDDKKENDFQARLIKAIELKEIRVEQRFYEMEHIINDGRSYSTDDDYKVIPSHKLKKLYDFKNGYETDFAFEVELDILNINNLSSEDNQTLMGSEEYINNQIKYIQNSHSWKQLREKKNILGCAFAWVEPKTPKEKIKTSKTFTRFDLITISPWDFYLDYANNGTRDLVWCAIVNQININSLIQNENFINSIPNGQKDNVMEKIQEMLDKWSSYQNSFSLDDLDGTKELYEYITSLFTKTMISDQCQENLSLFAKCDYAREIIRQNGKVKINHFIGTNFLFTQELEISIIPIISLYDKENDQHPYGMPDIWYGKEYVEAYDDLISLGIEQAKNYGRPATFFSETLGLNEDSIKLLNQNASSKVVVNGSATDKPLQQQIAVAPTTSVPRENISLAQGIADNVENSASESANNINSNMGSVSSAQAVQQVLQQRETMKKNKIAEYKITIQNIVEIMIDYLANNNIKLLNWKNRDVNSNATFTQMPINSDFYKNTDFNIIVNETSKNDDWQKNSQKIGSLLQLMSAKGSPFNNLLTAQELVNLVDAPDKYSIMKRLNIQNQQETYIKATEIVSLVVESTKLNGQAMNQGQPTPPISPTALIQTIVQIINNQIPNAQIQQQLQELQSQQQPNPQQGTQQQGLTNGGGSGAPASFSTGGGANNGQ